MSCTALTDDGCRGNVTGLKRMHKGFAVNVYKHCADGTHLLGYKSAEYLRRICSSGGVILESIGIKQRSAYAVGKHQTVGGRAVVVGGREALIVHSSCSAGCDDNGLGAGNHQLVRFHIHKHSSGGASVFVEYQLDGSGEIDHGDRAVLYLIAQHAHDLSTGIVLGSVHSLAGGSAAVGGYHCAVRCFVEFYT